MSRASSPLPKVTTPRVVLTPTPKLPPRFHTFFANLLSNEKVTSMGWGDTNPQPLSAEQMKTRFDDQQKGWEKLGIGIWGVGLLSNPEEWIGYIGVREHDALKDKDALELLYGFHPAYWGCGYATEAVKAVVEFAKKNGLRKTLAAYIQADNVGSRRVLERNGFAEVEDRYWGREWPTFMLELTST
ncbi:hypothetical protein HK104_010046 [Borealophlyctis nickersoniae]|nr:hypothetical protein HK104_010046 [Borealophlyctis nickersoniae]